MKQVMCALLMGFSATVLAQAEVKTHFDGCTAENTVFFAYTKDHKKAVEFCQVEGGYRYTYGQPGKPDITLTVLPGHAGVVIEQNEDGDIHTGFAIRKHNRVYLAQHNPTQGGARLRVSKHGQQGVQDIALIELEDTGCGFVDATAAAPDTWPSFYDPTL